MTEDELKKQIGDLTQTFCDVCASMPLPVVGGAAADFVAIIIAQAPMEFRDRILNSHIEAVRALIPVNASMLADEDSLQ